MPRLESQDLRKGKYTIWFLHEAWLKFIIENLTAMCFRKYLYY